jgi:hypothetical protein
MEHFMTGFATEVIKLANEPLKRISSVKSKPMEQSPALTKVHARGQTGAKKVGAKPEEMRKAIEGSVRRSDSSLTRDTPEAKTWAKVNTRPVAKSNRMSAVSSKPKENSTDGIGGLTFTSGPGTRAGNIRRSYNQVRDRQMNAFEKARPLHDVPSANRLRKQQ